MPKRIIPCTKTCTHYQIDLLGKKIGIHTNCPELPHVFLDKSIVSDCGQTSKEDYNITALLSKSIKSKFVSDDVVVSENDDDGDDIFMNETFTLYEKQVTLITYPNNSIIYEERNNTSTCIVSGNKDVLVYYLKKVLKKIAAIVYVQYGYIPIHAGAVAIGKRCFLLLGESYAGKSTLCYNLYLQGYQYINDDIVFLKKELNHWSVKSLLIYPNIRESAVSYLINQDIFDKSIYSEYQKSFSIHGVRFNTEDVFVEKMIYICQLDNDAVHILDSKRSAEVIKNAIKEHGKIQVNQSICRTINELVHDIECINCNRSVSFSFLAKQLNRP